jgi:hypothetical protein
MPDTYVRSPRSVFLPDGSFAMIEFIKQARDAHPGLGLKDAKGVADKVKAVLLADSSLIETNRKARTKARLDLVLDDAGHDLLLLLLLLGSEPDHAAGLTITVSN